MFFMVFRGSRLVFHGFRWVLLVIQGSRVVFHGSRWVLWFFKVPGGFKSELSAAGAKLDVENTPKRYLLDLYLGPKISLGLAGRRPASA